MERGFVSYLKCLSFFEVVFLFCCYQFQENMVSRQNHFLVRGTTGHHAGLGTTAAAMVGGCMV
jgi:hypothetical protein